MSVPSSTGTPPSSTLAEARELFPIVHERTYLFAGAITPAATPVRRAMDAWIETADAEDL